MSVFNPLNPIHRGAMLGAHADYRDIGGSFGSGSGTQMFGDDAPGATWQITFLHADLGPVENFVPRSRLPARSTPRAAASTRPSRPRRSTAEGAVARGPVTEVDPDPDPVAAGGGH